MLDAVKNGHWLCQRDVFGDITSKPPLYTWLCAVTTVVSGRITAFSLYLPGALAALGSAWLVVAFGRRYFGARAGLFGALAVMLCTAGLKQFALARTDGVFAFTVTATALLAFRAWERGAGWTWFWLMAAAATLTKGPLGVVLASAGLGAAFWERKAGEPLALRGSHLIGVGLFLLVTGGWFLLAYWSVGQPLIDKMIGKELVGHVVSSGKHSWPGAQIYQQPLYYLGRAAPWSLLAYYGLWRTWRWPAAEPAQRRFERFVFCWFMIGLLLFSLAPHQRADLLWPIMPAGALLAGRELARLTQGWGEAAIKTLMAGIVAAALAGFGGYYFYLHARQPVVRATVSLKKMAEAIEREGPEFPLTHVDDPFALQVYLNTLRPQISAERAAALLRGSAAAYVAVKDIARLEAARRPDDPPMYTLLRAGPELTNSITRIVSNRPELSLTNEAAFCLGTLSVKMSGARLEGASEEVLSFNVTAAVGKVILRNESAQNRKVSVRVRSGENTKKEQRDLTGHEEWTVKFGEVK